MQRGGRSRGHNRDLPAAGHGCTGPTRLRFAVLQGGLAGGANSSFSEKLQATRLENSLKSGISLFVLHLRWLERGFFGCWWLLFGLVYFFFFVCCVFFQKCVLTLA